MALMAELAEGPRSAVLRTRLPIDCWNVREPATKMLFRGALSFLG